MPSFLCFLEEIVVFVIELFVLNPSPIELYFLFVAEMNRSVFILLLLHKCRRREQFRVDFIVVLTVFVNLH
jgi:hypothetical protein